MNATIECPKCGSEEMEKGQQEVFPSTFMKEGTKFSKLRSLSASKEFEIFACMKCGHSEWYVKREYLY